MVYSVTKPFPKTEMFGLTRQLRRAAVSVPSNIAEGAARRYTREYIRFLSNALGSIAEVETQFKVAVDLGYTNQQQVASITQELDEIGKMTRRLIQRLEERLATSR
jgi:four helix bundle protein